jgi:putative Holliday junction resolvase
MSNEYSRILGIDFGSVRIGLAVSDPLKIIAQGFKTIKNDQKSINEIISIIASQNIEKIVIGNPLNLKGEVSSKAEEVNAFVKKLKEKISLEIILLDERFTSVMAHRSIISMGTKKKQRQNNKGKVDEVAAAILLHGYLDSQHR